MIRSSLRAFAGVAVLPANASTAILSTRPFSTTFRLGNSNPSPADKSKSQAIADVDNLLNETSTFHANSIRSRTQERMFDVAVKHPRDVAKQIRTQGPIAGRGVDVQYGNFGRSLGALASVLRSNNIRKLKKIQARYIRPAKLRKQAKSEWWRRRFSAGFKDLMAQVRDAKRRGY